MKPYYSDDIVQLWHGDCLEVLRAVDPSSVDAVVTDPPYGLEFMGVAWDTMRDDGKPRARNDWGDFGTREHARHPSEVARIQRKKGVAFEEFSHRWAAEAIRVLKPGAHLLAFGGTRTWHRLACAIEDAGFEVRDSIAWLYGSGFPKSRNLDGDWDGWGTALKPAHEPIVVARKPLVGTVAANVTAHGTGALNIDGCRIGSADALVRPAIMRDDNDVLGKGLGVGAQSEPGGRWPTNVLLDESQAAELDRQSGILISGANPTRRGADKFRDAYGEFKGQEACTPARGSNGGGASRFFPTFRYEAKAPTDERPHAGQVTHPTVKPLDLMRWLVRLVTPPGGLVLDPFAGSGTTAEACIIEGFRCITIEREPAYLPLIVARLTKPIEPVLFGEVTA